MGEVVLRGDRLSFRYETPWQSSESAFPLSLSMPLVAPEHGHRVVEAFLWGLLPDNTSVLERWGRRFRVSPRNPFRLLEHVGEDCAGSVQFVRPERVDHILAQGEKPSVSWITPKGLEERVRAVIADAAATRLGGDAGQFSLAGAQPKIALYFDAKADRWGVPEGRTPTTHILKPATGAFDGQTENEHFCLRLASELGFSTAQSRVMMCGDMPVIVIARYDRIERDGAIRRVHQEDFCQAAAIRPQSKYQNQGGPSPKSISEILRSFSSSPMEDVWVFAESLIFHWLAAATDAHGKNYSMLIAPGSQARLAPLYDLASALPYPRQIPPRKAVLAMKIGSHYRIQEIRRRDWENLAREFRLPPAEILERIANMAQRIPTAATAVAGTIEKEGVRHPVIRAITEKLRSHTEARLHALASSGGK
jgi:serine/threonine-protein kinase HipA